MTLRLICLLVGLGFPPLAGASVWHQLNSELRLIDEAIAVRESHLKELEPMPGLYPQEQAGFHSGFANSADSLRWVQVDLGAEYPLDAVVIVPAMLGMTEAYGFPLRFRVDVSSDPLFGESVTLIDHTDNDATTPVAPWYIEPDGPVARYVRFTATRLTTQPRLNGRYIFCLGELLVFSDARNVALRATVTAPNAAETLPTWSPRHLVDGGTALGLPMRPDNQPGNGWHSAIETTPDHVKWVQVDLGQSYSLQEVRLIPAHPRDYPDRFGFGFPKRFKVEASQTEDLADPTMIFDATREDFLNPGGNAVAFPIASLSARYVRVTATRLWERSGDFVYALAELGTLAAGKNVAQGGVVTCSDETATQSWSREQLVDGRGSSGALVSEERWLTELSARREVERVGADLQRQRQAALAVAYQRGMWLGGLMLGGAGLWTLLAWARARRERRLEMEALRERISRDLHDEIGSHLGSIRLMSEMALRETEPEGVHQTLEEIHRLAREAAESMRGIVWLVREGGAPTLQRLTEVLQQTAAAMLKGIDCQFAISSIQADRTASLEFHRQVLLFFREAAHNIARHARASHVEVRVSWSEDRYHLEIQDDGCGFDVETAAPGNGLANLRHRAASLKGSVVIKSAPEEGSLITLEAPLA